MKFTNEFLDLPPDEIINPNREHNGLNYLYWYGANLGEVALGISNQTDTRIITYFSRTPIFLQRDEELAIQAADRARGEPKFNGKVADPSQLLERLGYDGNGMFPGIVVGVNPTIIPEDIGQGLARISIIPVHDIDPYAQDFLGHIFRDD